MLPASLFKRRAKQATHHRRHFRSAEALNFSGTPVNPRWLKDGKHYTVVNEAIETRSRGLQKVNAVTGEAEPFFDAAKMEAAFAALAGYRKDAARRLANQTLLSDFNPSETGVLINFANDLFYYEFGSDRAVRVTQ